MPTSADLQHLSALITRLEPLSRAGRGELIRAQDWNVVVGALIELAQAVLGAGGDGTVPPHQHAGQVKLEWLDPALKTSVERGPLADPDAAGRLATAEREVIALRASLDGARAEMNTLRVRLSDLSGRDLARESQVSAVALKLTGVNDGRDDVAALRASLDSVQSNVAAAIAVGQRLTVDGKPADIAAIEQRLKGVEAFRDGLKTPSGQLLDAAGIDDLITARTNKLVTSDELTTAIDQRPLTVPDEQLAALGDRVGTSVKKDVTVTMGQIADGIRAETDQRLAGVDALVARSVSDAVPSLGDGVLAKVRPEIAGAVSASAAQLTGLIEKRVTETAGALRDEVTGQLGDLRTDVGNNLRDQVQKQVAASLDPITKRLDDIGTRIDLTTVTVTRHDDTLGKIGQRVEAVAQADTAARDQLQHALADQITGQSAAVDAKLDARFAIADAATSQKIAAVRTELVGRIGVPVRLDVPGPGRPK